MASWHGHRDDASLPDPVRALWALKFQPNAGPGSNVDVCVLDADGRFVCGFDSLPFHGGGRGSGGPDLRGDAVARHWAAELEAARASMKMSDPGPLRAVALPGLPDGVASGLRVFTRLDDPNMRAYYAPTVEVVPMAAAAWKPLAQPSTVVPVDAAVLLPWLSRMYPGGVMERTDQTTKRVYDVTGAAGTLALSPAGAAGGVRFAVLEGRVTLTDSGGGDFAYAGELRAVLTYRDRAESPDSLRGVFEGSYPRLGPGRERRMFPITGVFESLAR